MKLRTSDTIVAIATPLGEGAISIVRVSGPTSILIADRVFKGSHSLSETPGYTIRHGQVFDEGGGRVDEVLALVFKSPNSYTGEDSVEFSCHGGVFVTKKVLAVLIRAGARQADPGEFTKRAFLNGKMDLSQAEAVADLISARSERALRNSAAQLSGTLGKKIRSLRGALIDVCSLLELQLDFSEEDIPLSTIDSIKRKIIDSRVEIESILSSFSLAKVVRDGASVAIVGRPNVGKSSLFNRILMQDRSIVSSIPGTTRDFLEESVLMDGIPLRVIDTAGLRSSGDEVEAEGIARTKSIIQSSDVVVLVVDATQDCDYREIDEFLRNEIGSPGRVIITVNKIDLDPNMSAKNGWIAVSALTGQGVGTLIEEIWRLLSLATDQHESAEFICSSRHKVVLAKTLESINRALESIHNRVAGEFVAFDIRSSLDSLGEVTGEITTEDILNNVFSKFCIGK